MPLQPKSNLSHVYFCIQIKEKKIAYNNPTLYLNKTSINIISIQIGKHIETFFPNKTNKMNLLYLKCKIHL